MQPSSPLQPRGPVGYSSVLEVDVVYQLAFVKDIMHVVSDCGVAYRVPYVFIW